MLGDVHTLKEEVLFAVLFLFNDSLMHSVQTKTVTVLYFSVHSIIFFCDIGHDVRCGVRHMQTADWQIIYRVTYTNIYYLLKTGSLDNAI